MSVLGKMAIVIGSAGFAKFRRRYPEWVTVTLIASLYVLPCLGCPMDLSNPV